ncbi:hypothetical protein RJ640_003156 [Escallonia rubra]|uniref:Myb/SANT-like DNA-binding domain-containing protein n=1 Tax=Escallonia rubra TaxID=112253 RepID=A0AA88R9Q9_9ASTE|nr:hypothetical protein RJ640_003156 [Escallonia rubra]
MESNGLPSGMFSNIGSGMLGLEMSLHHHPQPPPQNPQNPISNQLQQHPNHHHPTVAYDHPQNQQSANKGYQFANKPKNQHQALSDEDEAGFPAEDNASDGKRKMSPWQRMKWTDNMVKLLIMVVFYIGDEAGSEGNDPAGKKKGGGVLQKKGKWKSVSRAMMERGFYVSPQQCEDKFNDLNKRYKRVNDILGKGTACRVVENQNLLDSMDHLSLKMKEEVKKLLNSKHLFFREMCAYHNSCNGGGGAAGGSGGGGAHQSPEVAAEPSQIQQNRCLHSSESASIVPNMSTEGSKLGKGGSGEEGDDDDDDDDEDEDDDEEEDEDDEEVVGGGGHEEEDGIHERSLRKRVRKGRLLKPSPLTQQFSSELMNVIQDGTKNSWEKRQWMKMRLLQLEEQRVSYQCQAFELEKQRLKWVKFSSNKEREMETEKLTNERMRLENERMLLLLRQKELELLNLQQHHDSPGKRSEPSSLTGVDMGTFVSPSFSVFVSGFLFSVYNFFHVVDEIENNNEDQLE